MSILSPLDLLALPDNEQKILRCLNRRPRLTIAEIADATQIAVDELKEILDQMVSASQLVEQFEEGQRIFSVQFNHEQKHVRNLPPDLLNIFEGSPDTDK
jgi:hypothetical protein